MGTGSGGRGCQTCLSYFSAKGSRLGKAEKAGLSQGSIEEEGQGKRFYVLGEKKRGRREAGPCAAKPELGKKGSLMREMSGKWPPWFFRPFMQSQRRRKTQNYEAKKQALVLEGGLCSKRMCSRAIALLARLQKGGRRSLKTEIEGGPGWG